MAWNDLSISQKSYWMNRFRQVGITTLSGMRDAYNGLAGSIAEYDPYLENASAPVYARGGHKFSGESEPSQRKNYNGQAVTLEAYKEMQRQAIRDAAVQKALTRTVGVAPMVDGKPAASCLYTATDNFGKKYRVAYNPELMSHPEKYGWEVAGPLSQNMLGNLYIMQNKNGVWDHGNLITGYDNNGNALISYSQGHAGGKPAPTVEEWQKVAEAQRALNGSSESYEEYVQRMAKVNSPEADYKRNVRIWDTPGYETLRFIGTPEDNAQWEREWNGLRGYPQISPIDTLRSEVKTFDLGGDEYDNPYTGEIRQGKKWSPIDHWLADNPNVRHGLRKAKTLAYDLFKIAPGATIRGVKISPRAVSDLGDIAESQRREKTINSFIDRVGEVSTPLAAAARAAKPLVDASQNLPIGAKVARKGLILGDKIVNALQFIDDFATPVSQFKNGGSIHIKKKNRGKFTALKKRTGHSASWFKAHGTPAQKKMAVFALNAKKWKHEHGGIKF